MCEPQSPGIKEVEKILGGADPGTWEKTGVETPRSG